MYPEMPERKETSVKISTVLIVDDSGAMRSLLVSTLEQLGNFRIVQAANGFEALRLLPREQIDLLITDINMPEINGLELLSFVRNNPLYKTIPVIIVSTEGSRKDIEKGISLGANEYLVKPFVSERLIELVNKLL